MNVRKFWFVNGNDVAYQLTSKETKSFLNNPVGLGFSKSLGLDRLGNEAEITENRANLPTPSGELLFYKDNIAGKYDDYKKFIQFAKIKPLKFYWQTPDSFESVYIDCEIASLEMSEVSTDGLIHCPIQLQGLSFWKNSKEHIVKVEEEITGGKIYPYTYPYTYEGNSFANIQIQNNGTLPSGFKFEIYSEVTNPILSLFQREYNEDSEQYEDVKYGEIRIEGTYDEIKVNTTDHKQSIYLGYQGSAIANPTSKFVLTGNGTYDTPFPQLRVGLNKLTFAYGGTFDEAVYIKWEDVGLTIF
ncbi:MAG: hypothetical protein KBT03_02195 [Bacteroidales bacterium]|nr:hypothetical protein [Candidatus Scybalousia scybalohippi]